LITQCKTLVGYYEVGEPTGKPARRSVSGSATSGDVFTISFIINPIKKHTAPIKRRCVLCEAIIPNSSDFTSLKSARGSPRYFHPIPIGIIG